MQEILLILKKKLINFFNFLLAQWSVVKFVTVKSVLFLHVYIFFVKNVLNQIVNIFLTYNLAYNYKFTCPKCNSSQNLEKPTDLPVYIASNSKTMCGNTLIFKI